MSASLQFGPEWMRKASTRTASNSSKEQTADSILESPTWPPSSTNNKQSNPSTIQQRRQPSLSSLNQSSLSSSSNSNPGPTPAKNPSIRSPGGFSFAAAASAAERGANLSSPLTSTAMASDPIDSSDQAQKDGNLRYSRERLLSLYAGGASSPLDHHLPQPASAVADPTSPGTTPIVNGISHKKKTAGAHERDFSSLRSPTGTEGSAGNSSAPRSSTGLPNGERSDRERERSGGLFQRPSGGTASALQSPTATTPHRERFAGIQGGVLSGVGPNPTPRRKKDGDSEASLSPGLEKGSWIRSSSNANEASAQLRGKPSDRVNPSSSGGTEAAAAAARPSRFRRDRAAGEGPIGPPADGSAGFKSRRERIPSVAGASDADSWRASANPGGAESASLVNGDGSGDVSNGTHPSSDPGDADSALASHATSVLDSLSLDANEDVAGSQSNGISNGGGAGGTEAPPAPEWKVEDQQWFYRDPAGNEQGPFPATTMHDWHAQSYFNNDLLMRREQESDFRPLGDIIASLGHSSTPFLLPPPAAPSPAPAVPLPSEEPPLPLRDQFQSDPSPFGGQALPGQPGFNSPFHQVSDLGRNGWGGPGMAPRGWLPSLDLGFGGSQSPGPASPFAAAPQQAYGVSPFGGPRDEYALQGASRGLEFGQLGSDPFGNGAGQNWDPTGGAGWNAGQSMLHQQPNHLQQQHHQHQQQSQPAFFDRFNQQQQQQLPQQQHHTPQLESQQAWGSPQIGYEQVSQHSQPQTHQLEQQQQQQSPWDGIQALRDANDEPASLVSNEKSHVAEPIGTPRRARSPAPSTAPSASVVAAEELAPSEPSVVAEEAPLVEEAPAAVEEKEEALAQVQTPPAEEQAIEQLWPQSPSAVEFAAEPTYPTDGSTEQRQASQSQGASTGEDFASRTGRRNRRGKKLELDTDDGRSGSPVPGAPSTGSVRVVSEEQFRKGSVPASSSASSQAPLSAWIPESGSGTPTSATAKAAPWAGQTSSSKEEGLSLREIQEAESRRAEAQRALRAAASQRASRASGSPSTSVSGDSLPTNMSWGLASIPSTAPSSKSSEAASSAWSAPSKAPKKTLMEIQEEERLRAQRAREAQAGLRKAYADSASKQGAPAAISTSGAGWNVVGAGGKPSTPTTSTATSTTTTTTTTSRPATQQRAVSLGSNQTSSSSSGAWSIAGSKSNGPTILPASVPPKPPAQVTSKRAQSSAINEPSGDAQPSPEFIKYCKDQLKGLNIKVDDFIEMLLSFPLDPSPDVIEIIAESVYANSSTLDGRRFAADFVAKRKLDASGRGAPSGAALIGGGIGRGNPSGFGSNSQRSASEVLKSSNSAKADSGFGFKVVNKKGKKGK